MKKFFLAIACIVCFSALHAQITDPRQAAKDAETNGCQ